MILPLEQAKRVAHDNNSLIYLPADRAWRPKTERSEPVQSRQGRKLKTHGKIIVGFWEKTTLRPLMEQSMLGTRKAAGWRLGDGITQMCDEWMRAYDSGWPKHYADPCGTCEQTGLDGDERCPECGGEGWLYREREVTETEIRARFEQRFADRPVYAVIVTPDKVAPPRLLSPAGRPRGDELGYTENPSHAMLDAGEAVPTTWLNPETKRIRDIEENKRSVGKDKARSKRSAERYFGRKAA